MTARAPENLFDYSTRLLAAERSNNRIAGIGQILKKKRMRAREGGRKGWIRDELSRAQQHMYSPSFPGSEARRQNQSRRMTTGWRCWETHNTFCLDMTKKHKRKKIPKFLSNEQLLSLSEKLLYACTFLFYVRRVHIGDIKSQLSTSSWEKWRRAVIH